MVSMADHLRSQEYERVRHSKSMLSEPRLSDEDAARLVEAYERSDTSAADYLALVTENRPFTPPATTHVVVIDSGTYCASVAMPVVFNSFLQDHGNQVVQELLSRYEVALVEKAPAGGIFVHVRSAEAEKRLVGQEVNLLGRKFKIKRQSPFDSKFYLDVFGVRSTAIANDLFMGLAQLGARPFFLTPRDVNMDAHVATPTWRFYFGQEEPPSCLKVRGFVTNQLVYGRKFYIARGKRAETPPTRAVSFKKSPYSVTLPLGAEARRSPPPASAENAVELAPARRSCVETLPRRQLQSPILELNEMDPHQQEQEAHDNAMEPRHGLLIEAAEQSDSVEEGVMTVDAEPRCAESAALRADDSDVDMQSTPSDDDVDMTRQMETGFKRADCTLSSFTDENPYAALEVVDCEFEAFEPNTTSDWTAGVLMVPHLTSTETTQNASEPLPTKRRTKTPGAKKLVAEEGVLVSAEEAELESHEDRVIQNTQHLKPVEKLLQTSKNMDKVVESMTSMPTAWSTAFCTDLANGGANLEELASIHLLNRILAANGMLGTFNKRAISSHLPLGKTRSSYVSYLAAELKRQSAEAKTKWEILRLLSAFELLLKATCPFLTGSSDWIDYLVGEHDADTSCGHGSLFSDSILLQLLRSRLGTQLLQALLQKLPTSTLLVDLQSLCCSDLQVQELLSVPLDSLSSASEAALIN